MYKKFKNFLYLIMMINSIFNLTTVVFADVEDLSSEEILSVNGENKFLLPNEKILVMEEQGRDSIEGIKYNYYEIDSEGNEQSIATMYRLYKSILADKDEDKLSEENPYDENSALEIVRISNDCARLINKNGVVIAEYPNISDIGCGLYLFTNADEKSGVMDSNGKIIIKPEYYKAAICTYAVNDIFTLYDRNDNYYIFNTNGELIKKFQYGKGDMDNDSGCNPNFYHITWASGSNLVISEHVGDMVMEPLPSQCYFIKRLYSEKIAAENYSNITANSNGEFTAVDKKDSKGCVLNLDGSLKFKTELNFIYYLDDGVYWGYYGDYFDYTKEDNYMTIIDEFGNKLIENIEKDNIEFDKKNRTIYAIQNGRSIKVKY